MRGEEFWTRFLTTCGLVPEGPLEIASFLHPSARSSHKHSPSLQAELDTQDYSLDSVPKALTIRF